MKRKCFLAIMLATMALADAEAFNNNTGELGNTVCFVRFADDNDDAFENSLTHYNQLFNGSASTDNSVYNYFSQASYGQLHWNSTFFPATTDTSIKSYKAKYERAYYQKYDATLRPSGYQSDTEGEARMQALVREIATSLSADITDASVIDRNDDGFIDNLCIIFSGQSELSTKRGILWPQRKDLALPDEKAIYVGGKKLVGYLMVFDEANGFDSNFDGIALNTGVLCHEMSHSLGTYDLYHTSGNLNPVGVWDLMSDNQVAAQGMTAYTKYRYCKWIDDIPEISEAGTYTLNPVNGTSKDNIAYKIKPVGSDEYFVVEYRKQEGFDANLPSSGLLVYRINPAYTGGNVNYNGTTRLDEQYIFRPGGTTTADGDISKATLSADYGRDGIGGNASLKAFYSDGTEAPFAISDVSSCGNTISFRLQSMTRHLVLSATNIRIAGTANSSASVKISSDEAWTISGMPDWLSASATSGTASADIVFTANGDNETAQDRTATVTIKSETETVTLEVTQSSAIVTAPSDLKADIDGKCVTLSWTVASADKVILADDFENTDNPNGWVIATTGDRGWRWEKGTPDKGYYRPYEGNYAATVYYAWEDEHQDEYFTSPTFASGKTLQFYSRTNAAGATPKVAPYYNVEVSNDNGETWTAIFNALTDCTKEQSGKYTLITLDLSDYMSSEMKVRFHCYDTDNLGLSYYWQIDNLEITGENPSFAIDGYAIYRNGVEIATTNGTTYEDMQPVDGENVYEVRAIGSFGQSSPSNVASVNYDATGIYSAPVTEDVPTAIFSSCGQRLSSAKDMKRGGIYIIKYNSGRTRKIIK